MRATSLRRLTGAVIALICALPASASAATAPAPAALSRKVLIIVEENRTYRQIVGSGQAPYLTALARVYGNAAAMTANYPVGCPSLAAYILLTSGSTGGICDDKGPRHHPIAGPNIFAQLDGTHRTWRNYAEDLPAPCARKNDDKGVFLVRHTAVPYYLSESRACAWGQTGLGRLPRDLAAGALPDYALLIPNACHDMHGAPSCRSGQVHAGDAWLRAWVPRILAGADYRAGRLVVIITWDEGSATDNHVPTLLISPTTRGVYSTHPYNHCSTLRTTEDLLRLPPLGCARTATSAVGEFHL